MTAVRVREYPLPFAPAIHKYAQLQGAARKVFRDVPPIRVRRCTELPFSSLARPVFDLELEGVPLFGWGPLPANGTCYWTGSGSSPAA